MSALPRLVSAIAIAVSLPLIAAGVALGASPEGGPIVRVELGLKASNGLHANLENSEDGTVTLELSRKDQVATYEVPGEATEAGLKVRFGRLGLINVSFTPTRTLDSTAPGKGCTGAPRTLREGVFAGTIEFTGERGFVRLEGAQATGSMSVISPWECPQAEATDPFGRATPPAATSSREGGERNAATISGASRACSCYFAAGVHRGRGGGGSIFLAAKLEEREGMKIQRATQVRASASAFDYDPATGTARLRPPSPFSGSATFEARPHRRPLWQSSIRVPLLGADPIDTGGPGFRVALRPEWQFG